MKSLMTRFLKDESGAQMAEYAILLMIALFVAAVAYWLGGIIQDAFEAVVDGMDAPE